MQARSENTHTANGKRHSVIDEESEEDRPVDVRALTDLDLRRDGSLSSCEQTHPDDHQNDLGFNKPIKSSNTSYIERQGMFGMESESMDDDKLSLTNNTQPVRMKHSAQSKSRPSAREAARTHETRVHVRGHTEDSDEGEVRDSSVEAESHRHTLQDRSVSHMSESASVSASVKSKR